MKDLDQAIESMNKAIPVSNKEVIDTKEEALIEPYVRKYKTKIFNPKLREKVLELAEKWFFYDAICAEAGIYRQRLSEEVSQNKEFGLAFTHARSCWIANKQKELEEYAKDKREKDWRALKYLLTIADKEYSERKYLTEAVSNQDAKILMQINAEKLTIAQDQGKTMLSGNSKPESISLRVFQAPKPETVKNKGKNAPKPSDQ